MKRLNKYIAVLLSALIVITSLPLSALAAQTHPDASGYSDEFEWNYNSETDTLYINTINGNTKLYYDDTVAEDRGFLPTYLTQEDRDNKAPVWDSSFVANIVIGKDIEVIDEGCYFGVYANNGTRGYRNLKSVLFENGSKLKEIAQEVFTSSKITSIDLPYGLEKIGNFCFEASALTEIVIPDTVYEIGYDAFLVCEDLKSVKLPSYKGEKTVNYGTQLFDCCSSLTDIDFGTTITEIPEDMFSNCTSLKAVTIPDKITNIGHSAFENCENLESVVMPENLKTIEGYAFSNCAKLSNVDFSKVTGSVDLGTGAFNYCTALTTISMPKAPSRIGNRCFGNSGLTAFNCAKPIEEIGDYSFADCKKLTSIDLSNVTKIGDFAFQNTSLNKVDLSATLENLGAHAFQGTNISELDLSATAIMDIPDEAFRDETNLKEIILPSYLQTIGSNALRNTGIEELVIPYTVYSLGSYFCANCENLLFAEFSECGNVTTIPTGAFYACPNLCSVDYIDNVKTIGVSAFSDCTNLQWVSYYKSKLEVVSDNAFRNCYYLNEFEFPETMTKIGVCAFYNCRNFRTVDLSECTSLTNFGRYAFKGTTSLTSFKFPKNNSIDIPEEFLNESGVINVTIPSALSIGKKAFAGTRIHSLILPDNCKTISEDAFANCTALEYVRMPMAYVPGRLYNPFTGSINIKTMIYPSRQSFTYDERKYSTYGFLAQPDLTVSCYDNTDIQRYCEKHNINYVILEEELDSNVNENSWLPVTNKGTCKNGTWKVYKKNIKQDFYYTLEISVNGDLTDDIIVCNNDRVATFKDLFSKFDIMDIVFTEGITSIPDNIFYDPDGLHTQLVSGSSLVLPNTVKSIGKNAFRNIFCLIKVVIPDSVTEIGEYAFADNPQLHKITMGKGVTEIKEGTFYRSNPVSALVLPANLKSIGKKAFGCLSSTGSSSKVNFKIPSSVEFIYGDPVHPENNAFGFNSFGVIDDRYIINVDYGSVAYDYVKQYCLKYKLLSGTETEEEKNYVPEINYREVNWGYLSTDKIIASSGIEFTGIKWIYNKQEKTVTITSSKSSKELGNLSFYRADKTKLTSFDYEVDAVIINGIKIVAGSKDPTMCLSLFNPKNIIIDDTCTRIYNSAFKDCTNLEVFTFPDSVTSTDGTVFTNCTSLRAVKFSPNLKRIPQGILMNHSQLEYVTIPQGCTTIDADAFKNCVNLHEINIPDSVTSIGGCAFYKDIGVQKITLGKGFASVGTKAFYGLVFCQKVYVNSEVFSSRPADNIKKLEAFGMLGESTTGAQLIFDTATSVSLATFYNANITEINIGANASKASKLTELPTIKKITVDENNKNFYTYGNSLYNKNDELILGPRALTSVVIKEGTTLIGENAFIESSLKSVTIPDSVVKIDKAAFAGSSELKSVTFGDSLEEIGYAAFLHCPKIKFLYFPESLQVINTFAFYGATNLASVIFNDELLGIAPYAFQECDSLKDVVLNEKLYLLSDESFADCDNLESVYVFNPEYAYTGNAIMRSPKAKFYTMVGSSVYQLAREKNIPYVAYTDEDCFYDDIAAKLDSLAGYLGYCDNGHGDIDYLTVYEPTCTQDGYVIGVCEYCSAILEEKHIDACGHNYENTVSIPATETTEGVNQYKCTNCNDTYTETTPALNGDNVQKTMCELSGNVVIASNKQATEGTTPLAAVTISLNGDTLATTDKNGSFSFKLETGVYELVFHYNYGFDRTAYVVVTDEDIDMGTIPLIACDWNKDGVIDDGDYTLFRFVIGSTSDSPSYLSYVDMNNDGRINVKDLVYMNNVKGLNSSTFEYPSVIIGNQS